MSKHIAFRKRSAIPKFNYNKGIDAVSICYKPSIILNAVEKLPKQKKIDPIEQEYLNHEHQVFCQLSGYLPISDSSKNVGTGPFAPQAEKNRQLKFASEAKKSQLMKRFGMNDNQAKSYDMKEEKMMLRHGEVVYAFIKTKRSDNPRALQLAVEVATGRKNIIEDKNDEEETEGNKMKFKIEMKKKQEDKRIKDHLKRVEKRKEVLDRMKVTKKERAAAIMKAAMEAVSEKRIRDSNPAAVKPKTEVIKKEILSNNINATNSGMFMNVQQEETNTKKKKPQTVQELKELLKLQVENKKMFSKLHETGEDDLAKNVKLKQGWDEAASKLEGEKFDSIAHLTRNVKKAEFKNKKKFSKIDEVLTRQKQGKHKKLLRKQHNLREKRVHKIASKMNKLQKKGHIVPSFMMTS